MKARIGIAFLLLAVLLATSVSAVSLRSREMYATQTVGSVRELGIWHPVIIDDNAGLTTKYKTKIACIYGEGYLAMRESRNWNMNLAKEYVKDRQQSCSDAFRPAWLRPVIRYQPTMFRPR